MNKKFSQLLWKYSKIEQQWVIANLAKKIGITPAGFNKWINGKVAHPNCEKVFNCAQELGLNAIQRAEFLAAAGCKDYIPAVEAPKAIPVVGKAICHPSQFFGRENALRRIYNAWHQDNNLQHIAIIGPK